MGGTGTICSRCLKPVGTDSNGKIMYHTIKVTLSGGQKKDVRCPGTGKKAK